MKRTLLLTLEYPPERGGIASAYSRLAHHLPDDRFRVLHLKLSNWFWPRWIAHFFAVRRVRRRFPFEMLLVGHLLPLGYTALFYKLFFRFPYGVFVHGLDLLRPRKNPWKRLWARLILRRASLVIANSEWTRRLAVECGAKSGTLEVLHPSIEKAMAGRGNLHPQKILAVGRLIPRKGFNVLIRAFAIVRRTIPTATLDVVGDGPERQRLEELVKKLDLTDSVRFHGSTSDDELDRCYASAALFALPTRETPDDAEGFGLVFLEAAAHGLPAVAGRGGGVGEAVVDGKTGLLVDPTDPQAVADAIAKLLSDDELRRTGGDAGRERALREFSASSQAARLAQFLERI